MKKKRFLKDGEIAITRQDLATMLILSDRWIAHLEGEKEHLLAHYQEVGGEISEEEDHRYCDICNEIRHLDELLEPYKEIFIK